MTPDMINGLIEFCGSLMLWMNVRQLYRDKEIKGVSWTGSMFFTTWGLWNLFYYPNLNQWYSFAGGVSLAIANLAWLILLFYYRRRNYGYSSSP